MVRNMKMELPTFYLILYQSKKCGHRIHVLFMMYDVYWYCDIVKWRKNEWLWKFWKRNDLYENFEKGGVVEKRGRRKRNPCPMRLWILSISLWHQKQCIYYDTHGVALGFTSTLLCLSTSCSSLKHQNTN